jgi:hypothetical protein
MSSRSTLPLAIAAVTATAGLIAYAVSPLSRDKSRYTIPPITIATDSSADDVYLYLRDPATYLDLTPESQYTVVASEASSSGVNYTLHHQVTGARSVVTKCRRDWVDSERMFWDTFPMLGAPFKVLMRVVQQQESVVRVEAEVEIEASAALRAFFGIVSPRQVKTRLERLKATFESQDGLTK